MSQTTVEPKLTPVALRDRRLLLALMLASTAVAPGCDSGRQVVAWEREPAAPPADEFPGDEYLPWFGGPAYHARWPRGISADPGYFPVGVWLQQPRNAARFSAAGINLFHGLYMQPTAEDLANLTNAGADFIANPERFDALHGEAGLKAWLSFEQPDNAQPTDTGYAPCIPPAEVLDAYAALTARDATRPSLLQFGRGFIDPQWEGRGACLGQTEHYSDYVRGADLLAAVVYPLEMGLPVVSNATAIDHLRALTFDRKAVFAFVQASSIYNDRPSPEQIRFQAWLAIVHGAAGIQYYCHRQTAPASETECLDHAPTRDALTAINRQLNELSPVLNTRPVANGVVVTVAGQRGSDLVHSRLWRHAGSTYVLAVSVSSAPLSARFALRDFVGPSSAEVLAERRTVPLTDGVFSDEFAAHGVHVYRERH